MKKFKSLGSNFILGVMIATLLGFFAFPAFTQMIGGGMIGNTFSGGQVANPILLPDGSVAAPSLAPVSNPTVGLHFATNGNWHLFNPLSGGIGLITKTAANGYNQIFLDSNGAVTGMIDSSGAKYSKVAEYLTGTFAATYNATTGAFSISNYGITGMPASMYLGSSDIDGPTYASKHSGLTSARHFAGYDLGVFVNVELDQDGSLNLIKKISADKVTNGTFTGSITGWLQNGSWAWSADDGGKALHTAGSSTVLYQTSFAVVGGAKYRITFDVVGGTAGTVTLQIGGAGSTAYNFGNASYSEEIVATNTGALQFVASSTFDGAIDNVTCKQISGVGQGINLYTDQTSLTDYVNRLRLSVASGLLTIAAESAGGTGDANIDLILNPKGTGAVGIGSTQAAGALTGTLTNSVAVGNPSIWFKIKSGASYYAVPGWLIP